LCGIELFTLSFHFFKEKQTKMAKLFFIIVSFLVVASFLVEESSASGECPQVSQVYSCQPTCLQDTDCSYGKKCCANSCHTKSCVEGKTQGSSGSKGSSGGTGTYCNNVKCNSYEKCALDRITKRMKCVRS